ncbi:MAG: peptidoglycan DD-metalloendopeptidase family protein [Spirochaetia bacterium]|nr:peptidoglycan DD-metalloendopeptidase family protein [Spirochaetia bacterium]
MTLIRRSVFVALPFLVVSFGQAIPDRQSADAHYQKSKAALAAKDIPTALSEAYAAEAADSKNGMYAANTGDVLTEAHEYEKALQAHLRARDRGYKDDWNEVRIAMSYLRLNQFDACIRILEAGAKNRPEYAPYKGNLPFSYVSRGRDYNTKKRWDLAQEDFKRAYAIAPEGYVLLELAMSYEKLGNRNEAIRLLADGLIRIPDYEWFRPNLATLLGWRGSDLMKEKKLDAALKDLMWARELAPDADWISFSYAICIRELSRYEEAIQLLKDGIPKFPKYEWFLANLPYTYFLAVDNAIKNNDSKRVQSRLHLCLDGIDPVRGYEWNRSIVSAVFAGVAYLKDENQFSLARKKLERAFPEEPWLYEQLGWAWLSLHDGATGGANQEVLDEVIRLRRKGMTLFEAQHPDRSRFTDVSFPLKGWFWVASKFDDQVWSHVGLQGKYCMDLIHVDSKTGSAIKPGTDGQRNEDSFTFGQPLYAVFDGVVEGANDEVPDQKPGEAAAHGNSITIQNSNGTKSYYDHLKQHSLKVKKGDSVRAGEQVASIGNTGQSGGPHLHFCLMDKDTVTVFHSFRKTRIRENGVTDAPREFEGAFGKGWLVEGK